MLRISWTEKVKNEEVLSRMNIKVGLNYTIKSRKLRYFGHISRQNSLQKLLLEGKINGKRGRVRPRTSWYSNIKELTGLKYQEAVRISEKRDEWRTIASNHLTEDGTTD